MAQTTVQPPAERLPPRPARPRLPRRSFASRLWRSFQTRVRQIFSRDALFSFLKSLPWVVPMTVLIWVYAEREQTTQLPLDFRIVAKNSDPNRFGFVELRGPDGRPVSNFVVHVELSGPQGRQLQLQDNLNAAGGVIQVDINNFEQGRSHTFKTTDLLALASSPDLLFEKNGQTITSVSPKQIEIFVDPVATHPDVRVSVRPNVADFLEGPPLFDHPAVTITGPRSVLDSALAQGPLEVYADLRAGQSPGPKTQTVPIVCSVTDPRIKISPPTVLAQYTVKASEVSGVAPSVSLLVTYSFDPKWDKLKVQYYSEKDTPSLVIFNVPIIGPADVVKKIIDRSADPPPKATLDLSTAHVISENPTELEGAIRYDFGNPAVRAGPDAPKSIRVRVVERKSE